MLGDGPGHDGLNRAEATLSVGNVGQLSESGTISAWQGDQEQPVVVGNYGYAITQGPGGRLGNSYSLIAYNLPSGTQAWKHSIGFTTPWFWEPAVSGNVVYVGISGAMWAFRATTGRLLWKTVVGSVSFGAVTVTTGTSAAVYAAAYESNTLYSFDPTSGAILWSVRLPNCCAFGAVAVVNGVVYVANGELSAYNAATGAPVFSTTSSTGFGTPVVSLGVVFTMDGTSVFANRATTGKLLWSTPIFSDHTVGALAVDGATVIAEDEALVVALSARSGAQLWSHAGSDFLTPAIANHVVYEGSLGAGAEAIDEATGTVLFSNPGDGLCVSSAIVAKSTVYLQCGNGMNIFTLPRL